MTEMLIAPSIAKDTEDSTYMVSDDKKSVDETMPYITKEAQEEPLWKIISIYIWAIGILALFIKKWTWRMYNLKKTPCFIYRAGTWYLSK